MNFVTAALTPHPPPPHSNALPSFAPHPLSLELLSRRVPDLDSHRGGWIEIIAGGMFSGKSEELIRRLRRAVLARQRVQVFKPVLDDRFSVDEVVSRDDRRLKATPVRTSQEMLARIEIGVQVVGIDEVQFFDDGVLDVCMHLADAGIRVIAAGLDQDYMRRPSGPMPALLAVAEDVSKSAG